MDPDFALENLRKLAALSLEEKPDVTVSVEELAEAFQSLDQWISRSGFLPREWVFSERRVCANKMKK